MKKKKPTFTELLRSFTAPKAAEILGCSTRTVERMRAGYVPRQIKLYTTALEAAKKQGKAK